MAIDIEAPGASEADLQRALSNLMELRGCRLAMTSDDTAQNVTTIAAVSFDSATWDTDTFWSAGSPARITIPSGKGIKYVELVGQVSVSSSTADSYYTVNIFHRNSAGTLLYDYGPSFVEGGNTSRRLHAATGPVLVTAGDYFELAVREETDNSVTIASSRTSFALKVVGMDPV